MKLLRFIFARAGRWRHQLVTAVLVGVASGAASVTLLSITTAVLRQGVRPGKVVPLFIGLCAAVTVTRIASIYLLTNLGQGLIRDLRLELCGKILATPLARLEELGPHRLLATLTEDVNAIAQALVIVPLIVINATIVFGCLIYLGWLDVALLLVLVGAMVFGAVTYVLPVRIGRRRFRLAREQDDRLFGLFRGLIEGIKELKLNRARRGAFGGVLEEATDRQRSLRVAASVLYGSAAAWGHLLFFVFVGFLLFGAPRAGEAAPFSLVSYTIAVLYMMGPLQGVLDSFTQLGRAEASIAKVTQLGFSLADPTSAEAEQAAPLPAAEPAAGPEPVHLELQGVVHSYHHEGQDCTFTLGPIDTALRSGEVVFLVGGNGSGKTTLAKILVGLYAPDRGEILLDGRPVAESGREDYRQLFAVVFSDFHLFEQLFGLHHPELDAQAQRYLAELQLAHKVSVREGRLSTLDLSLGQRKRLALLVAYLEDRPFYVFDEWAADQDPVFKEVFYREILANLRRRGKGAIVISHDDRYFGVADRILKLEDGQLRYEGPPGALPVAVSSSLPARLAR